MSLAGRRLDVRPAEVDNPYHNPAHAESGSNPKRITARRNLRESPLVRLAHGGSIDEDQTRAGFRFRGIYERTLDASTSAGTFRERVDGSRSRNDQAFARVDAVKRLAAVADRLDQRTYFVLRAVAGEGRPLRTVRDALHCRRGDELKILRAALDELCDLWGLKLANDDRHAAGG